MTTHDKKRRGAVLKRKEGITHNKLNKGGGEC